MVATLNSDYIIIAFIFKKMCVRLLNLYPIYPAMNYIKAILIALQVSSRRYDWL